MKTKRLISLLVAFTLLCSILGLPNYAFAYDADHSQTPDFSENRADISVRYMGEHALVSAANGDMALPDDDIDDFTWKPGDYIYIGVYVKNMTKANDPIFKDNVGLYKLSTGLAFDGDLFEFGNTAPAEGQPSALSAAFAYINGTYGPYVTSNTYPYTTTTTTFPVASTTYNAHYQIGETSAQALTTFDRTTLRSLSLTETDASKVMVAQQDISISPTYKSGYQRMFKGDYLTDDEKLIAIFPLKMKTLDATTQAKIESNPKTIEGYFANYSFVMTVGDDGGTGYRFDATGTDATTNLYNYFNIRDSVVNLFPATYTVTYNENATGDFAGAKWVDGTTTAQKQETVSENTGTPTLKNSDDTVISTLLTPPDGYIFDGWYTSATTQDSTTAFDTSSTVTANTTVYAKYIQGHKATFNKNATDAEFTLPDATTASTVDPILKPTGTAFLGASETIAGVVGTVSRTGYDFDGWYTKKANGAFNKKYTDADLQAMTADSVDLYAKWVPNPDDGTYTIIFDKNGGTTDSNPTSVTFEAGDTLATRIGGLPVEPTRDATYKFLGWYTNLSGDGVKLTATTDLKTYTGVNDDNKTKTVYAKWGYADPDTTPSPSPDPQAITVKFDKSGGNYAGGTYEYTTVDDKYVKQGDPIDYVPVAAEMKKDNAAFDGWYTTAEDSATVIGKKIISKAAADADSTLTATPIGPGLKDASNPAAGGTITLYARWKNNVTVTYNRNGIPVASPTDYTIPADQTGLPDADFTVGNITFNGDDFELVEWNTEPNGSGESYTPDATAQLPDSDTTLYAIWNSTAADKVSITFHGNGTTYKKAELNPNTYDDVTDPSNPTGAKDEYVLWRAPGQEVTEAQMPNATRQDYVFHHWDEKANAAATGSTVAPITIPTTDAKNLDRYAIWKVSDDATKRTVTFKLNGDGAKFADNTTADKVIEVADGDCVGPQMPANPSWDGHGFQGWMDNSATEYNASDAFTADTVITGGNKTVKAFWADNVKIEFDLNSGKVDGTNATSIDTITLEYGQSLDDIGETLKNLVRANYTFEGWFYQDVDSDGNPEVDEDGKPVLTELTENDAITKNIKAKAKFSADLNIVFTDNEFEYDNTAKTPLKSGNYKVYLADGDGNNAADVTSDFPVNKFTATYTDEDNNESATAPKNAGTYTIDLVADDDPYTEYQFNEYDGEFEIKAKVFKYIISNNYQYLDSTSDITDIGIALETPVPSLAPTIDSTVLNDNPDDDEDIIVTFTNVKDNTKVFKDVMPNEFGEYTIEIKATDDSNFDVGDLISAYKDLSPKGEAGKLYLLPKTREVRVNYGTGTALTGTLADGSYSYTTVSIPVPTTITAVALAKTKLQDQTGAGVKTDVPKEGTDFNPPANKTIDKFVTDPANPDTTGFDKTTDITGSGDPLVIYAVYKDASWTVTFKDTKDTPEADKKYTLEATKSVSDGVQKIDGVDVLASDPVNTLPKPSKAPDNLEFAGWVKTESNVAVAKTKTKTQFTTDLASDIFTDTTTGSADITVYAAYVKSSDAKIDSIIVKENTSSGADIPYTKNDFKTASAFDKDAKDQYMVASNDAEKAYLAITTSQPGSTVEIIKDTTHYENTSDPTDKTATVPLTVASNGKTNDITVKITAPDGSTKEYVFHILRKAVPYIRLGYGNSPAGLIRRDTAQFPTKTDADNAIQAFKDSDGTDAKNLKYDGLIPAGGDGNMVYTTKAWKSYPQKDEEGNDIIGENGEPIGINYDLDDTALFVYEGSKFKVPGYEVIDETGTPVTGAVASIDFVVRKQEKTGASKYDTDADAVEYSPALVEGSTDTYNLSGIMVRMDVYKMNYKYTITKLDGSTENLEIDRPIIILGKIGDIALSSQPTVNIEDADWLAGHRVDIDTGNSLVAYRCMDVKHSTSTTVNIEDVDWLGGHRVDINEKATSMISQYYKPLD